MTAAGLAWVSPTASAKEPILTAIELYDAPTGAAYVQLTDLLINGKAEMKDCTPFKSGGVDRSTYGKMGKVVLNSGGILERGDDGVMQYNPGNGQSICVVPTNLKLDRDGAYTLSGLAEQALLHATVINAGAGNPLSVPQIKKGVKLVFLAAPNQELAEFLRAERASDIAVWQTYIAKYPAAGHVPGAKLALAGLFVQAGEASIQAYDNSAALIPPLYRELKSAKSKADQAHALATDLPSYAKLADEVKTRMTAITDKGRAELDAYHAALSGKTAGYAHLLAAKKYSDIQAGIDAFFAPEQALAGDVLQDVNTFEAAMQSASGAVDSKQFDQALAFVVPYRAFAEEEPRVAAVIDADYGFHLDRGNRLEQSEDWQGEIKEFEKAAAIKDTGEARESLANAKKQLVIAQDKDAATKALAASKEFQQQHNMVRAYETLAALPPAQQALVAEDMKGMESAYVAAAALEAKNYHQAHSPIRGPADQVAMEKAFADLEHAYKLSGNESYKDKAELDGGELSAYLLEQAKHYLDKPGGSGTELGWAYLDAARKYKASNLDAVRDAMVQASAAHAMRSKLSIRVQFRDQTSQRDSQGVAGQLENAIITGLESSGVPVKVVRGGATTAVEPDFELDGDVLEHHKSENPTIVPMDSQYRAGTEQVTSDAWNKSNREYEKAQEELKTAQGALGGAESHGKGKEIKQLTAKVAAAQKALEDAHVVLDSTPRTVTRDIIRPYSYHKRIINISGVIKLQFRISESLSEHRTELVPISREDHKQDVLLEDVKPDDTEGIKSSGTPTDTAEFMTALENSARDELISAVRKRVEELPRMIYEKAAGREKEDDLDGAGESYLRYLNLTKEDNSVERQHAKQFLLNSFDMRTDSNSGQ